MYIVYRHRVLAGPLTVGSLLVVWRILAELHVGPLGSFLQPTLSHFERKLFVVNGAIQICDGSLRLEYLLQSLLRKKRTQTCQIKVRKKKNVTPGGHKSRRLITFLKASCLHRPTCHVIYILQPCACLSWIGYCHVVDTNGK